MPKKVTAKPQADGSVLVDELIWKTKEGAYRARRRGRGGKMLTFAKLADAKRHRDSQAEADEPKPAKGASTMDAIAAEYLAANTPADGKPTIWSPNTAKARAAQWRRLSLTFGGVRPDSITKTAVLNWSAAQSKGTNRLAPGSIRNHVKLLTTLLAYAMETGRGTRNAAQGSQKGTGALPAGWGRARALTDDAADAYIAGMTERFQLAGYLARYCGVRSGEVRGLTVDRVDFFRGTITIDRQLIDQPSGHRFEDGEWHEGPSCFAETKTKRARVLEVPREVTDAIAAHLARYPAPTDGPAFVLTSQGRDRRSCVAVSRGTMRHAWEAAMTSQKGTARFHDLRHTFVTNLLDDGVPLPTVSELAGHSSPTVTLHTYAHPTAQGRDAAKQAIAGRLARPSGTIQAQSAAI